MLEHDATRLSAGLSAVFCCERTSALKLARPVGFTKLHCSRGGLGGGRDFDGGGSGDGDGDADGGGSGDADGDADGGGIDGTGGEGGSVHMISSPVLHFPARTMQGWTAVNEGSTLLSPAYILRTHSFMSLKWPHHKHSSEKS